MRLSASLLSLFAGLLFALALSEPLAAQSNPLTGSGPGESAAPPSSVQEDPATEGSSPGPLTRLLGLVQQMQVAMGRQVNGAVAALREGQSLSAVLTLLGLSLTYGVLHAAGPGHGKFVVSSYFLARDAKILHGVMAAGLISFVQALSAIVIVGVLALIIGGSRLEILQRAETLERASYALIVAFGLYMAWKAWTGRECCDGHETADARGLLPMAAAVGIRPCSGALLILLFTLAHGVFHLGVAATFAMGLGVAITVSLFGVGAIGARRGLFAASGLEKQSAESCCGTHHHHHHAHDHQEHDEAPGRRERVARWIAVAGGIFVSLMGLLLLAGSLSAPLSQQTF